MTDLMNQFSSVVLMEMSQGHTENRGPDVGMDDPTQNGVQRTHSIHSWPMLYG
jgi:hypothetical protein